MNPLISIIITTCNQERYIELAINSALKQTYTPIELIVIDGGSTDNTIKIATELAKEYGFIMEVADGKFAAGTRNLGVKHSQGELIAFLDGDDEFYPDALETLYKLLPHSCQMIYGDFRIISPIGEIIADHIAGPYRPSLLARQCFIHSGALLIRRNVFDTVGYFDETLHIAEDIDFNCRMALAGCQVTYVCAFIMKHRHWRGSISARPNWKMDTTNVVNKYYDLFKKRFKA